MYLPVGSVFAVTEALSSLWPLARCFLLSFPSASRYLQHSCGRSCDGKPLCQLFCFLEMSYFSLTSEVLPDKELLVDDFFFFKHFESISSLPSGLQSAVLMRHLLIILVRIPCLWKDCVCVCLSISLNCTVALHILSCMLVNVLDFKCLFPKREKENEASQSPGHCFSWRKGASWAVAAHHVSVSPRPEAEQRCLVFRRWNLYCPA